MSMTTLGYDLPAVNGDDGVWGVELNAILGLLRDSVNTLILLQNAQGASGFVFYDPTNGWPANTPTTVPYVFVSIGSAGAPAPTGGADNSVWLYQLS